MPLIITPSPVVVERRPIYLYVPVAHQQNWKRYCGQYSACGQPVYFVRDEWVRERYEHEHPGWNNGHGHGHGKGHDKHDDGTATVTTRTSTERRLTPSSCFWNTSPACSRRAWKRIFGQLLSMARSSGGVLDQHRRRIDRVVGDAMLRWRR